MMDDTEDLLARDRAGIATCARLIREALEQNTDLREVARATSISQIPPCIRKESLRLLGFTVSDSVLEVLIRWPRLRLCTLLKNDQQMLPSGIQTPTNKLINLLAEILGKVYWAARNCTQPAEVVAIDRTFRGKLNAGYRALFALSKSPQPKVERAITEERLMGIDLSRYADLITYLAGRDWPLERKKILFLQTAVRLGFDYSRVVLMTSPFFGQMLTEPFVPLVVPTEIEDLFLPPPFDVARQTPQQWAAKADEAWKIYRDGMAQQISEWRDSLIARGELKEFDRPRRHSGISGLKKAAIADEATAFEWAAFYFFTDDSWATIAKRYPTPSQQKGRRRDQVRKRASAILKELGLPVRK